MSGVPGAYALFPVVVGEGEGARGELLELWITPLRTGRPRTGIWRSAEQGLQQAYEAARLLVGRGIAPMPYHDHEVFVHGPGGAPLPGEFEGVDGRSLGLAAVVAFARLWLDRPGHHPDAVAFTGRVSVENGEVRLKVVDGIEHKLPACGLRRLWLPHDCNLPARCAPRPARAQTVGEVLQALGLSGRARIDRLPDEAWRVAVESALESIQRRSAKQVVGDVPEPWLAVALHLDRLIALAPSPLTGRDRARCVHASAWRIIARSYAGWLPPASELHELRASLGGLPSNLKVRTAALVDMCELSAEINGGGPRLRELVEQSEASLRPLGDADPALGARVFGTIGRALTRLGRHDEARERLRTALDLHADGENEVLVESPRSRLYLAQGHFHAGEIEAAHTELEAALREIDEHERASRDRDYLRTTRMFVLLALAKCRVVLGGTDRVVRAGLELDEAFALHPGTGISSATLTLALLRTRAWVAGTSGDETAREAALGAAESVRAAMGSDADARQAARADAILAEARAKPTHEGVVD